MLFKIVFTSLIALNLAMLGALCCDLLTSNEKISCICTRFYEIMFVVDITLGILAFLGTIIYCLVIMWI